MRHITRSAIACSALLALSAAFAQDSRDTSAEPKEVPIESELPASEPTCFLASTIRNFDGLDDEYVYVEGRSGEHFLLTMNQTCRGLRNAENIAITNPSNRVCSNNLAEITYEGIGGIPETCWITQVEGVADKAAAQELVTRRTMEAEQ